ncbi:MAG: ribonuclease P protein component [Acholeplasmataceae bacterium]|nr:ribonuclease P protein component [Acholeplasmataceae bacterium]
MKKKYRIKKNSEIDAIFKEKNQKGDTFFTVYHKDDETLGHFRFALSIGRKYGSAVERNLIKRRVRVIIEEYKKQFIFNKLIVVVIKPKAKELDFHEMKSKLLDLLKKSKVLENVNA